MVAASRPERLVSTLLLPGPRADNGAQPVRCIGFSGRVATPVRRRELPTPYLTLIVGLGDPMVALGRTGHRRATSFVSGLQHESVMIERHGLQRGIHLELPPLTAYTLIGLPVSDLTDELIALSTVLGPGTARLVDSLVAARTWGRALREVRSTLLARMHQGPLPTPAVAWVWQQLRAANGAARIDELVERTGVSHRHLATRFREQVGMTPKAFARLLRFEHSLALLRQDGTSTAAVAAAAGYYDESHLHRDYRAMGASAPGTHRNN